MNRRWRRGQAAETRYWKRYVAGLGADDLAGRLDPARPLQDYVTRWLDPEAEAVSILDVGAGPLTTLGKVWGRRNVTIIATDILADSYDTLLAEVGIDPPVRTIACSTDELEERFGAAAFDLIYVENALDHHADVVQAISSMLHVLRPGGHLVLRHARDEAETQGYDGLHQWNLRIESGDYVLWNRETRTSVGAEFAGAVEMVGIEHQSPPWELVVLKKTRTAA